MDPEQWLQSGDGHFDSRRFDEAIDCYGKAVETDPGLAAAWNSMGAAFQEKGVPERAMACYKKAIARDPVLVEARFNLGLILQDLGKWDEAGQCYRSVLQLKPDRPDALNNLGIILHEQGRFEQALSCFRRVIAVDPSYVQAYNNLGKTMQEQGKVHEAIHGYEKAVALRADYAQARFNLGLARLSTGDFPRGWEGFEWRFRTRNGREVYPHVYAKPRWQGESFSGKRLLVHAEQGLGDTLQFVRYLPQVKALGGTVIFEALAPLQSILQGFPGIDEMVLFSATRPATAAFDCHIPLLSLPRIFGTGQDTIPGPVPYLFSHPDKRRQWGPRIPAGRFRVGVVWAGKPTHGNDRNRSVSFSRFAPLAEIAGVRLIGFQTGPAAEQAACSGIPNMGGAFEDFSDTAAVLDHLDLVISVDTALAHLAGAMGKPVWLVLPFVPDWRWMLGRSDSPWYPTMRLFRQEERGDWDGVFRSVALALKAFVDPTLTPKAGGLSVRNLPEPGRPGAEDSAHALFMQGTSHLDHGRAAEAAICFRQALLLQPGSFEATYNLGNALLAGKDPQGAIAAYQEALGARPDFVEAWNNLGTAHEREGNHRLADSCYRKALAHRPESAEACRNLARLCRDRNEPEEAISWYEKALAMGHDAPQLRFDLSLARLLAGRWKEGFEGYEARFQLSERHRFYPHRYRAPLWDGSPFGGKRLLVHSEQGLGDQLQFVRYLPGVKARGGTVLFETRMALQGLFSDLEGVDRIVIVSEGGTPETEFDLYVPLMSLPKIFGTIPETVPASIPYLYADPEKTAEWKARITGDGLRVGIVWAGMVTDPRRACPLPDLFQTSDIPGIRFWGLQKGDAAEQARMAGWLSRMNMTNLGDLFQDFSDTAAAMENLDLIISIDTAVAHLAGAMGKPVWLLLPKAADWRWLLEREDTPWYPTMRLFRQEQAGSWEEPASRISRELERLASEKRNPPERADLEEANDLLRKKEYGDAEKRFFRVLTIQPESAEALHGLGLCALAADRCRQADSWLLRAVSRKPASSRFHYHLGLAKLGLKRPDAASQAFQRAVALDPAHFEARYNLALSLKEAGQREETVEHFRKALEIRPDSAETVYNLANNLREQGESQAAEEAYRKALALRDDFVEAWINLGFCLKDQGRLEEAVAAYDQAIIRKPDSAEACWNRSIALLLCGDLQEGWKGYEWRFRRPGGMVVPSECERIPRWDGAQFHGKRLLVWAEQGFGDTIQFLRYLPLVRERGGTAIFKVMPQLHGLLRGFPGIDELLGADLNGGKSLCYDFHVPLMSLPGIFETTIKTLPIIVPYLFAEPAKIAHWRREAQTDGVDIGIVWSGNPANPFNAVRACTLNNFEEIAEIPGIRLFGLQKGPPAAQAAGFSRKHPFTNFGESFTDFSDTAGAIETMDLVITTDTSVAHLAGAMGKPAWLLLSFVPDWRWLLKREDSPWYPTMRLFRQEKRGDWEEVFGRVVEELKREVERLREENSLKPADGNHRQRR